MFTAAFTQSTVTVSINGVKKGVYSIKPDQNNVSIVLKKSDCKKINQLTVLIKNEFISNAVYKRTLELTEAGDQPVAVIPEVAGAPGQFIFKNNKIKSLLIKGKPVKLYLVMDPADSKMMMPSKRIYMGTLLAK